MVEKLSDVKLDREYRRRKFKGTLIALLIIVIVSIPLLGISYLYCEHLTDQYAGDILSDIRNEVLANDEKLIQFKVLKYKKKAKDSLIPEAAVYIVTEIL